MWPYKLLLSIKHKIHDTFFSFKKHNYKNCCSISPARLVQLAEWLHQIFTRIKKESFYKPRTDDDPSPRGALNSAYNTVKERLYGIEKLYPSSLKRKKDGTHVKEII